MIEYVIGRHSAKCLFCKIAKSASACDCSLNGLAQLRNHTPSHFDTLALEVSVTARIPRARGSAAVARRVAMADAKSHGGEDVAENTPLVRLPHSAPFPPAVSLLDAPPRVAGNTRSATRRTPPTTTRR
jgi:hypothetical protein